MDIIENIDLDLHGADEIVAANFYAQEPKISAEKHVELIVGSAHSTGL